LTGQVKEDVISRISELGLVIRNGEIVFDAALINTEEILDKKQLFEYYSIDGENRQISLDKNQLVYTFCQVPVIYTFSDEEKISVYFKNGKADKIQGNTINEKISTMIFSRSGEVKSVEVTLKADKNVR